MSVLELLMSSPSRRRFSGCCLALLASASTAGAATLPDGFTETSIATGLASPTAMTFAPDGRLFVCEQAGRLRVIKNGGLLAASFVTLSVNSAGERGLLGVAFDPEFASNRFVYVYYTTSTAPIHNRVSRFTASATNPDVAVAGSEVQILNLPNLSSATNHNGGAIHFAPDGTFFVAVGENANSSNAPSLNTVLGKMLRINKDGSIPTNNPFFNQTTGMNRAIWARGLRNPFTFAFQRGTGRLHINDVGQDTWEEVDLGTAGANYGWPAVEGPNPPGQAGVTYPIHSYQNAGNNCAIVGATFYNPPVQTFPSNLVGRYFFGDFCGGFIRTLDPASPAAFQTFATGISSLVDLTVGDDGALYYLTRPGGGGSVFRVVFTNNSAPEITGQPASLTVSVGQPASFQVTASGTAPLRFQWQRNGTNIPNATARTFTIASTTNADNGARFRAVVTNDFGSATSNEATLTVTNNTPPQATITAPANGSLFRGGQTIAFSGTGTDTQDGTLPASAFTWRVDLHHDAHVHPHVQPVSGITSGSFVTSDRGHPETTTFYRITLTVRDSGGLTGTTFVDLQPRTSQITLATNPAGLQLTLDGQPVTTPFTQGSVEGVFRTLGVVSPQTSGGSSFEFVSWSDGGAATHDVATPTNDTTFTATFQPVALTTLFTDGFGSDLGWVTNPNATDTATTGQWQRGNPQGTTSSGAIMQLDPCAGGTPNCLSTGLTAGASAGANDVDGGVTSIQSPAITLSGSGTFSLSFDYYFAHLANSSSADFFRVSIVGASATTNVFQELGTATIDAAAWVRRTVDISAFAGQTIRIRIEAADAATGSLVEAGVDNVTVTRRN
jgi:glucose/arabinose dehydrogenase